MLPRIGGSHADLAQALAIAVLEHDRYAPRRVRASFGRPHGVIGEQGSLSGRDTHFITQIFHLPDDRVVDLGNVSADSSWTALRRTRMR